MLPRSVIILILLFLPLYVALPADAPKAVFPESRFTFGEVLQGRMIDHEFVLRNEGAAALRILGVGVTTELRLGRMPVQIEPASEIKLRVRLDTAKLSGPFKGEILISLNDPAMPKATLLFEGRIIPPIELSPRPVFFVAARRGEPKQAAIEIINHEPEPLRIESVEHPGDRFTTRLETIEDGQRYRLVLVLNPEGPGGKKTEDILVRTSSRTWPLLNIAANTYLRERVYTFPAEVDLGSLRLADIETHPDLLQKLAQTLMVYQWGGSDFQAKISTDLPALDLKSERGLKGDRYQITATLLKDKITPGSISGNIFIMTNDPEFPKLTVPVHGEIQ